MGNLSWQSNVYDMAYPIDGLKVSVEGVETVKQAENYSDGCAGSQICRSSVLSLAAWFGAFPYATSKIGDKRTKLGVVIEEGGYDTTTPLIRTTIP